MILQIISLYTLVDVIIEPKAHNSGKLLPIDINLKVFAYDALSNPVWIDGWKEDQHIIIITEKTFTSKWKKGDKKYGNKGRAFIYLQSESYVKKPVSAWCYIPTSRPPEPSTIFSWIQPLDTKRPD